MSKSSTRSILITGATGNTGRELTKGLFAHEVPFRAMVRSRKDAEAVDMLEGADVVVGDFNDSTSLAQALIEPFC